MPISAKTVRSRRILKGSPFYGDATKLFCNHGHQAIWFYVDKVADCPMCKMRGEVGECADRQAKFLLKIDMLEGTVAKQSETIDQLMS